MNIAIEQKSKLIEHYYISEHMSGDQVAATLGLSPFMVKKYLRQKGLSRNRQEARLKGAATLKSKDSNISSSPYEMQEARESRLSLLALQIIGERHQSLRKVSDVNE
jgi:predicted transcriptional regulator